MNGLYLFNEQRPYYFRSHIYTILSTKDSILVCLFKNLKDIGFASVRPPFDISSGSIAVGMSSCHT